MARGIAEAAGWMLAAATWAVVRRVGGWLLGVEPDPPRAPGGRGVAPPRSQPTMGELDAREARLREELACVERTLRSCGCLPPRRSRLLAGRLTLRRGALRRDLERVREMRRRLGGEAMAA